MGGTPRSGAPGLSGPGSQGLARPDPGPWQGLPHTFASASGLARSYPGPHGRTLPRQVVPRATRSYLKTPLRYDRAPSGTTAWESVRPREPEYDHAPSGTTARREPASVRARPGDAFRVSGNSGFGVAAGDGGQRRSAPRGSSVGGCGGVPHGVGHSAPRTGRPEPAGDAQSSRCRQARVPKTSVEATATSQARSTAAPNAGPVRSSRRVPARAWARAPWNTSPAPRVSTAATCGGATES